MSRKGWRKLGIVVAVLVVLLALDVFVSLEGLPVLAMLLAFAFLVTDRIRLWLKAHDRPGMASLPFLAAAMVLLLGFTRGRDLSQGTLLLVTLCLVFDILLMALALIGEASKRGLKAAGEFLGLASMGLALGFVLSLVFLVEMARLGGTSLAGP